MATHGNLGLFDNSYEDWDSYMERLTQNFVANDIKDATKQRAILLSACGAATYQMIKNILSPWKPTEVSFKDIVAALTSHLQPKPSETVQQYKFHSRTRNQGESVSGFVAKLKKLLEHCNFGTKLDEMICDCLVCGIGDERWQKRLLLESILTYDKALKFALAMEVAEQQVKRHTGLLISSKHP